MFWSPWKRRPFWLHYSDFSCHDSTDHVNTLLLLKGDCFTHMFASPAGHTTSWAQQSAAAAVAGYAAAGALSTYNSAAGYHHPASSSAASDPVSGAGATATTTSSNQFPGYSHHQPPPPPAPPGVMPGQHCASHHQASAWTRHHAAQSVAKAVDVPTPWTDNYRLVLGILYGSTYCINRCLFLG